MGGMPFNHCDNSMRCTYLYFADKATDGYTCLYVVHTELVCGRESNKNLGYLTPFTLQNKYPPEEENQVLVRMKRHQGFRQAL